MNGRIAGSVVGLCLVCALFGANLLVLPARAGEPQQKEGALRLGHYSSPDGLVGAVIDRTREKPRLRLDADAEIYVLTPEPASRDEIALRGDDGRYWLRFGSWAQVTLHCDERPAGVQIFRDADAEAIPDPGPATTADIEGRASSLAAQVQAATGARVAFRCEKDPKTVSGVALQAMDNAARALKAVGGDDLGKDAIKKGVSAVVIRAGKQPLGKLEKGTLIVEIDPTLGPGGRPSSRILKKILEDSL